MRKCTIEFNYFIITFYFLFLFIFYRFLFLAFVKGIKSWKLRFISRFMHLESNIDHFGTNYTNFFLQVCVTLLYDLFYRCTFNQI